MDGMDVIDAHLHLWDPAVIGYDWLEGDLDRRLAVDEARAAVAGLPPRRFVFMEAGARPSDALAEIDWVASLDLPIAGMIAFAPLEDGADVGAHLDALRARDRVVGVRRLLQGEEAGFARTASFLTGARLAAAAGFTFDACVRTHEQLHDVIALADAVPELTIVLDHLGKPAVGSPEEPGSAHETTWARDMVDLAVRANAVCKLSGLPGESAGGFTPAQLRPFLDVALDAFGPDRVMYASDWPASFPGATDTGYAAWETLVREWAQDRGVMSQVFATTAARVYGL